MMTTKTPTKTLDTEHHDARLAAAKEMLADHLHMRDFSYWGGLALGETWAFTLAQHRDSDILAQSNFAMIRADMEARFPDDVSIERWNHWPSGWVEHLAVRLMTDEGDLTDAGHAILRWGERLDDHLIADEADFSRRKFDACWDNFESDLAEYAVRDNLPDDWQHQVFDEAAPELTNDGSNDYGTDLRDELVAFGFLALSELEPVAYYDLGASAFYRYVVEFEDGQCVWLTADCLLGNGFVKSSEDDEDVSMSAVEITEDLLPANVAESLDVWVDG